MEDEEGRHLIFNQMPYPSPFELECDEEEETVPPSSTTSSTVYLQPTLDPGEYYPGSGLEEHAFPDTEYKMPFSMKIPMDRPMMERLRSDLESYLRLYPRSLYHHSYSEVQGGVVENIMRDTAEGTDGHLSWRLDRCAIYPGGSYPVDYLHLRCCEGKDMVITGPRVLDLEFCRGGVFSATDYLFLESVSYHLNGSITLRAPVVYIADRYLKAPTKITVECDHLVLDSNLIGRMMGKKMRLDQGWKHVVTVIEMCDWLVLREVSLITMRWKSGDLQLEWDNGELRPRDADAVLPYCRGAFYEEGEGRLPTTDQFRSMLPQVVVTAGDVSLEYLGYYQTFSIDLGEMTHRVWSRPSRAKSARAHERND